MSNLWAEDYRVGFNPDFVKRVHEKRRKQAAMERREADLRRQERIRQLQATRAKAAEQARQEKLKLEREAQAILEESRKVLQLDDVSDARYRSVMGRLRKQSATGDLEPVFSIICRVADIYGISPAAIIGSSRRRFIIEARHEAIFLAHRLRPDMSLSQLGREFQKDHTTILHAINKSRAIKSSRAA